MKKNTTILCYILGLILGMIFTSCARRDDKVSYVNEDLVVVSKDITFSSGRYSSLEKTFMVRRLKDTTQYAELRNDYSLRFMTDSLYFNTKVGDTIHFEWIAKYRFWRKK